MTREDLRVAFILAAGVGAVGLGACGNFSHIHSSTGAKASAELNFKEESRQAESEAEVEAERTTAKPKVELTQTYKAEITIPETQTVIESTLVSPIEPTETTFVVTTEEIPAETTTKPYSATCADIRYLFSDYERQLLLKVGSIEAGGQGVKGIALVMRVILNRSENSGLSIEQVIFSPRQFASTGTHLWAQDYIVPDAYEALALIENGWDESLGATHFCTTAANAWHSSALTFLYKYGDHEFYRK